MKTGKICWMMGRMNADKHKFDDLFYGQGKLVPCPSTLKLDKS